MSGLNLGKLMQEAGIKGAKPSSPPLTLAEARALSRKVPEPTYEQDAMKHLPPEFASLKDISKGEEFMKTLVSMMEQRKDDILDGKPVFEITEHVIYGIVQLAHHHRDRLQGSKRRSFMRIIPKLLDIKDTMIKRQPSNLAEFLERKLEIH